MLSKARMKYFQSLSQKKVRERDGKFLIEGWRTIEEAASALKEFEALLLTRKAENAKEFSSILSSAKKITKGTIEVSDRELSQMTDTVHAQGIAAVLNKPSYDLDDELTKMTNRPVATIVALDGVSEPGNLGTIIRTCDWFGIDAVLLNKGSVELYNPKVLRSTVGSIFHLPIIENVDLGEVLPRCKKTGFSFFGATVDADIDIRRFEWPKKVLIVIGNEAHGISSDVSHLLDGNVSIPKFGRAESLNAGVAVGIILSSIKFLNPK